VDPRLIAEYWEKTTSTGWLPSDHPGRWGANVVDLYGDDAKYSKAGEKFIQIHWNAILSESKRSFATLKFTCLRLVFVLWGTCLNPILKVYLDQYIAEVSQTSHGNLGLDLARYPIMVLRYSLAVPDYTLMAVYQVIAWSFQVS